MNYFSVIALVDLIVSAHASSHVITKNAAGISAFAPAGQNDDSSRSLSQVDKVDNSMQPDAPTSSSGGDGPWAKVTVGEIPEGCNSLSASIDADGSIKLQPSLSGSRDNLFLQDGATQAIAWGTWRDTLDEVGWSSLSMGLSEDSQTDDGIKMYAAGVIEGFLSAGRMQQFYHNSRGLLEMNPDNAHRTPLLKQAFQTMVSNLVQLADDPSTLSDPDANQDRLVLLQTWGIRDGFLLAGSHSTAFLQTDQADLSIVDMFILNSDGVIDELEDSYGGPPQSILIQATALRKKSRKHSKHRHPRPGSGGHCTGLVRLTPDHKELYFGHTTWEPFSEMTRVWKLYDFPLKDVSARKISFSSYPGCVSSTDDYYLMDNGLAITETTLNLPKEQVYSKNTRTPDFMRIMAANRLAKGAYDWGQKMSDSATGTYSSQWLIVDYNKFKSGEPLQDGGFVVLEQAPANSHLEDMTSWLNEKGYWASYDRAFFDDIRSRTGDASMVNSEPKPNSFLYTKDETPRAQIIRRSVHDVTSLDSFRTIMSSNHGNSEAVDQAQLRVPRFAVSARDDLKDPDHINPDGSPEGGVDAKVTSSCLFSSMVADAISSPSHAEMPPFKWTDNGQELWPGYPHEGLPDQADFDWVRIDPHSPELIRNRGDNPEPSCP
eukprot:gnl/MRDRNA2_/MRDRNA2_34877_c0_seq1.p1 gnl/MRDRNA2_/MRDRNA2_34877_c0~~gnl/MRDRNA2_/MRDRNA2_34877_c0_seq1.p1  ORF type:complete len:658 (-),score=126.89 gnl/MRDRNA2_/MRDRNA2_34877_c0_seq1:11-1984(-)